jgi:NADPH:quinone reductase-like Zn-dependent oxidoreductase
VLDSRSAQWPGQVRTLTGGCGVDLAVNALPGGAATAIGAVRDGGRLATITSDAPAAERHINVSEVYVAPDGPLLSRLGQLLAAGVLRVEVAAAYRLEDAAAALAQVRQGTSGRAIVLAARPPLASPAPVIQIREDQAGQ